MSGLTILSNAIGQREILCSPLQLAKLSSTIANRGHYYSPHVVKETQGGVNQQDIQIATYKEYNHSVFIGFAPVEDPKIAIVVYIENAGSDATCSVSIGGIVMDKYLKGEYAK